MVSIIEIGMVVLIGFLILFLYFKIAENIKNRNYTNKCNKAYKYIVANFEIGDTVKVITCPRDYDNADAYAGYIGEIESIHDNGKSIILKGETSYLVIPFTQNLKLQKIKNGNSN